LFERCCVKGCPLCAAGTLDDWTSENGQPWRVGAARPAAYEGTAERIPNLSGWPVDMKPGYADSGCQKMPGGTILKPTRDMSR